MTESSLIDPYVVECPIPANFPICNSERYLFVSKRQRDLTHAIHKYPAKFIPDFPNWFIRRYTNESDLVLDPFMGSGTTNLEAALLNRRSVGVDVDAFSRFIATIKTTPIPTTELADRCEELIATIESKYSAKTEYPAPDFPYRDNWFKPYVMNELAFIKNSIEKLACYSSIRALFLLSMSAIVKEVSEANHHCLRTCIRRNNRKDVQVGEALQKFVKKLTYNVSALQRLNKIKQFGEVSILEDSDARNLHEIPNTSVDLAVTSPPYLNAIDYPRTHQLEMYWLGFANGSLTKLKEQHVGSETVRADYYRLFRSTGCSVADEVIGEIYQIDNRRAGIASRYMLDMFANLDEVHRVLKSRSRYVVIIGNNRVRGQLFETWKYLTWYAKEIGFDVEHRFVSGIINHFMKIPREAQMQDDHILILRKQ